MSRKHHSSPPAASFSQVATLKECPLCEAVYHPDAFRLIREKDGEKCVHITCGACHVAILARVENSSVGIRVVGVVTDLTLQDAVRVHERVPVGEDDVLTLHALLRQQTYFESLMIASQQ